MDFYNIEIQRVKEILQSVSGKISFIIDIWTSSSIKSFVRLFIFDSRDQTVCRVKAFLNNNKLIDAATLHLFC